MRDVTTTEDRAWTARSGETGGHLEKACRSTIWVDLDNSPHVPFFTPLIRELERRGYPILITGRPCFQVKELADLAGLRCKMVGRHWGRNPLLKVLGTCLRALQLAGYSHSARPALAVSHGSRSQILACTLLGIPTLMIDDYECSRRVFDPDWLLVPEMIPEQALGFHRKRILRYPGIKEDVYITERRPDTSLRASLGLTDSDIVITVRPPASEAHYHNPESDILYRALMDGFMKEPAVSVVLVPRNQKQALEARSEWAAGFGAGKIVMPEHAVDGIGLIWCSDLVVSGGGTMNREAAALGVPVYSFFRGPIGAVDQYLAAAGKLVLLESVEDIGRKVVLKRRAIPAEPAPADKSALRAIVSHIVSLTERQDRS